MEAIEIIKITVLESGELSVTPVENWNNFFQFIYRTAAGVVWDKQSQSFMSPIPKEWLHMDWYANIITAVRSEMGVNLKITPNTEWIYVPESLKQNITNFYPSTDI